MKKSKIIIIVLTGIAILVSGILTKQHFFLMLPLFVSLFVMSFQSEANRVGALIGACNAVLYTITYICMGVYGSAASAFLFSFPLQLMTFFNWKKNAYKKTVVFKRMSTNVRIISCVSGLALWANLAGVFYYLKYEYAVFDSVSFLLGFIVPILTMLAYIEYTYLWIFQAVTGLFLNIQMVSNDISQLTYLIYGVYALYCVICAFINVRKFHKEQQNEVQNS
ncbi:MAG: nicotinamide mononucleotide transporter [Ruminococcaceae bacterium]|nr:nicotinamide mononucleotide transporter [Oscillospiraceae bacterium]